MNPTIETDGRRRDSITLKLVAVGILSLSLLIPTSFNSILRERIQRRDEAVNEITSTWGSPQTLVGPILILPYRYNYKTEKDEVVNGKVVRKEVVETAVDTAYILPEELRVEGTISPKTLHRGIYDAVVYSGRIDLSGRFPDPDYKALKFSPENAIWSDAVVSVAIPDLRGARGALNFNWDGKSLLMLPGSKIPGYTAGAHVPLGAKQSGRGAAFSLVIDLNGSSHINFAPLGVRNLASIKSSWPDPKFQGAFLPVDREVKSDGFSAKWDVSYYGRSYPQQGTERGGVRPDAPAYNASTFGVAFLSTIDSYRNVERSTKYGILFIAMAFSAFFLFEILYSLRIHPVQYVLVGLALALFFLTLLSLSEFIKFSLAYLLAASAATTMIVLYSAKFLGSGRRTLILGGELAGVYAYLYIVLQLQDYSLLMGSVLLVGMLAAMMYFTRDIDWYSLDKNPPSS